MLNSPFTWSRSHIIKRWKFLWRLAFNAFMKFHGWMHMIVLFIYTARLCLFHQTQQLFHIQISCYMIFTSISSSNALKYAGVTSSRVRSDPSREDIRISAIERKTSDVPPLVVYDPVSSDLQCNARKGNLLCCVHDHLSVVRLKLVICLTGN